MDAGALLALFDESVARVREALALLDRWDREGRRSGQYHLDVVADEAVVPLLVEAGVAVLSEESGLTGSGPVTVVVDPVDGSTNAALGLPWFATSLCALDGEGPLCALVANLATGERFRAVRGLGATRDGVAIRPSTVEALDRAVVGFSGRASGRGGWWQYRALGAASLDLCAVASGRLDGYLDWDRAHGVWDYLGGWLVCREVGAALSDLDGDDLVVLDPAARRGPVAAATPALLEALLTAARPRRR